MVLEATQNVLFGACMVMVCSTFGYDLFAREETSRFTYVAMGMTGWSAVGYLAMYSGAGVFDIDGHTVFVTRYLDWVCTTNTFLFGMSMLSNSTWKETWLVLFLNMVMIICGLVGATFPLVRTPLFIVGCLAQAGFAHLLLNGMQANADRLGGAVSRKFRSLARTSMISWCAYPAVYIVCEVSHVVNETVEVALYAACDIVAKCICAWLLLNSPEVLEAVARGVGKSGVESLLG